MLMGLATIALLAFGVVATTRHRFRETALARRTGATVLTLAVVAAAVASGGSTAGAAVVPTVDLASAASHSVLAASTVTNTGASVLDGSLGLWPGTSVTGFPPGEVLPPGTINIDNPVAQQAQSDLTVAYDDAA